MACPTCDATFECCARTEEFRVFQCPRCGTVKVEDSRTKEPAVYVPKLVERCREFSDKMNLGPLSNSLAVDQWRRIGIAESINVEKDRPQDRPKETPQ